MEPPPEPATAAGVATAGAVGRGWAATSAARRAADSRARRSSSSTSSWPSLASASARAAMYSSVSARCRPARLEGLGELRGLIALVVEIGLFLLEVFDRGVELVGRDVAGAERDAGQLIAREDVVDVARVFEEQAERGRPRPDERADRHLAEVVAQQRELGLLGRHTCFGLDDLAIEFGLGVDRLDVVGGDVVRLLLESFEFVDDVLDASDAVDRRSARWRPSGHARDEERRGESDGEGAEELSHTQLRSLANMTNMLRKSDETCECDARHTRRSRRRVTPTRSCPAASR